MAREKAEKLWIGGGAVAALALAGGLWMFAVNPELSDASSLRSQTNDTQVQNTALQSKVAKLKVDDANIGGLRKVLAAARGALPSDDGMAALTKQLGDQAHAAHVSVTTLTAGTPAAAVPAAASTTPTDTSASTSSAPPAPTSPTSSGAAAPGLYAIPVTLVVSGSVSHDLDFLHAIQHEGPRAALVTSAALGSAGTGSAATSLTVQLTVFSAPQAPAVAPTPGATPTASPTTGG
jgi:hypothetical protein